MTKPKSSKRHAKMIRPPLGTRIRLVGDPYATEATVTKLTKRGFAYEYDHPIPFGRAAWGQMSTGGELFCDIPEYANFKMWEPIGNDPVLAAHYQSTYGQD